MVMYLGESIDNGRDGLIQQRLPEAANKSISLICIVF